MLKWTIDGVGLPSHYQIVRIITLCLIFQILILFEDMKLSFVHLCMSMLDESSFSYYLKLR